MGTHIEAQRQSPAEQTAAGPHYPRPDPPLYTAQRQLRDKQGVRIQSIGSQQPWILLLEAAASRADVAPISPMTKQHVTCLHLPHSFRASSWGPHSDQASTGLMSAEKLAWPHPGSKGGGYWDGDKMRWPPELCQRGPEVIKRDFCLGPCPVRTALASLETNQKIPPPRALHSKVTDPASVCSCFLESPITLAFNPKIQLTLGL